MVYVIYLFNLNYFDYTQETTCNYLIRLTVTKM